MDVASLSMVIVTILLNPTPALLSVSAQLLSHTKKPRKDQTGVTIAKLYIVYMKRACRSHWYQLPRYMDGLVLNNRVNYWGIIRIQWTCLYLSSIAYLDVQKSSTLHGYR